MRSYIILILAGISLAAGIWLGQISFRPASQQVIVNKVVANLKEELQIIDRQASGILKEARSGTQYEGEPRSAFEVPFFIYNNNTTLVYWSDNSFIPPGRLVTDTFSIKFLKTSGGDYLARKWTIDENRFLIALIPLHREYPINNVYLNPEWNRKIFPEGNINTLELNAPDGIAVCLEDQCLFKISFLQEEVSAHEGMRWLAVTLIVLAIVLLFAESFKWLTKLGRRHPDTGFILLIGLLWLLRFLMTSQDFPGVFIRFSLFDPQNFASSNLNRSLGDLLLNELALMLIGLYLFRNYHRFSVVKYLYRHRVPRVLFSIASAGVFFFAYLFPFVVIQTIYNNSSIVLDISQTLQFDALRLTALAIVVIAWVCAFLFSHVFIRLLIDDKSKLATLFYVILGASIFSVINEFSGQLYLSSLLTGGGYFLLIYLLSFYKSLKKVGYTTFAYLFTAIIGFSLNSMITIHHFTRKEKIESQFRFASNFLVDRDYFGEYLLREVSFRISNDAFIRSRLTSPFLSKDAIRQKVRQVFLPSYFNKYDVNILLFGPGGNPINNRSSSTFLELINVYNKEAFKTDYEGVYFVNSPTSDVTQRYLIVSSIVKSGVTSGYVVLELLLKKIIPENVYPELLIDNSFQQFYRTQDLSYAIYGKDILNTSGTFNYERFFSRELLGDPDIHLKGIVHAGYVHVALEDGNNRVAVVSSPVTPVVYVMANFAFLLVLGLSVLLVFIFSYGLINLMQGHTLFFSARIQLVLNLAFFLPLIIVSVTTLRLTSLSSQEQLNTEYLNKAKSFGAQVETMLDDYMESKDVNRIDFENQLTDLAKLFNLDANVYTPGGKLLASSQPTIFETGLIASYVNPDAAQMIRQGENAFIGTERVGNLNYYVSFASLKSPQSGKLIGILGLPFFQSLNSLEKIQIEILANILNIFAVIFLALIVVSYAVSEWLTFPLRFITRSLSRTTLTKVNQPLTWGANDEIGMMVKEYNQMLYKLSESKAELEQTQRERAWREIAQQVAHEIKNPLTPMKLTLQQLERSLQAGADVREKTAKALISLLSQVDTLNEIASSFSSFAKMPEPDIQRLELVTLLKRITDLHSQAGSITLKTNTDAVFIAADEQLLGRIFSNIILNAFQAARPGTPAQVDIRVENKTESCVITFSDNGKGIDAKVADRVFVPYFSTKRSGSGLGLAISRQGIEQMGGKIWFESIQGTGTTFFIELLLWNQ